MLRQCSESVLLFAVAARAMAYTAVHNGRPAMLTRSVHSSSDAKAEAHNNAVKIHIT